MDIISFRNGTSIGSEITTDRSFLYGDGVFTTIAVKAGKPLLLQRHLARLISDCNRLKIHNVDAVTLKELIITAIKGYEQAVIRLTISRGSGHRGYVSVNQQPVYWTSVADWPKDIEKFYEQGISTIYCKQRLSVNSNLAGIKHCNRLEQVMARNEWTSDDIQEGIMLDTDDNVIEGTMSNIFIIKDEQLFTSDLTFSGVAGVMRAWVIDTARHLQIPLMIDKLSRKQIENSDALFVTNSVIGIWPVNRLNDKLFSRHPIQRLLHTQLRNLTRQ